MSSGGKVLVTGATGFVGAAVARALIARGEDVVLLARKTSPRGNVDGLDARVVIGDLRDANRSLPPSRGLTGSITSPPTTGCGRPIPTKSSRPTGSAWPIS